MAAMILLIVLCAILFGGTSGIICYRLGWGKGREEEKKGWAPASKWKKKQVVKYETSNQKGTEK